MELERTESEQVEALRRWWAENWLALVGGVVLGVGGLLGWNYYGDYRANQAEAASELFESVNARVASGDRDAAARELETLSRQHAGSPYVALGHFKLAEAAAAGGDWTGAQVQLRAVLEHSDDPALSALAGLRLARSLWAQGEAEAALAQLDAQKAGALAPLYAELRGDIAAGSGQVELAREAYGAALASEEDFVNRNELQRKLDELP